MDSRPNWELLPLLYAAVVVSLAFVTLGAGVLLALASLPASVVHLWWPGIRRTSLVVWLGLAVNGLLFAAALLFLEELT